MGALPRPADYGGRSLAILFISVPSFWTATIVIVFPAIWWRWSPSMELIPFAEDPLGNLRIFLLPAALLGMALSGTTMTEAEQRYRSKRG